MVVTNYPHDLLAEVRQRVAGRKLTGFTPGQGLLHPDLMLVGEAPGRHEEVHKIPFSGASGKELMKMVASIGYSRQTIYITSVVRQRPYSVKRVKDRQSGKIITKKPNRTPTKGEVLAFAKLFDWELGQVDPKIIVPLGNTALQRLLGPQANIGELHGQLITRPIQKATADGQGYQWTTDSYKLFPMYHPAAVLYRRKLEPTVKDDWRRLGTLLQHK